MKVLDRSKVAMSEKGDAGFVDGERVGVKQSNPSLCVMNELRR
jgi:hypothetical protein